MNKYRLQQHLKNAQNTIGYYLTQIPRITRYLLIATLVIFIVQQFINLYGMVLQSYPYGFNPLQLFTYAFLHGDFGHWFFNALAIWIFGSPIERHWKEKRYLIFVVVCIIGAGITHMVFVNVNVIGISGLVFGLLLAYGMMFPDKTIFLMLPPMPVKAKYLVIGYGVLLLLDIASQRNDGIAHFAHLGGALSGFLLIQYWRKKPPFGRR